MDKLFVVSMARDVRTRTLRAANPTRRRFRWICDGRVRLVRKRPNLLNPDVFDKHHDELWKLQEEGILEVRVGSPEGPRFEFGEKAPEPEEEPSEQGGEEESAADDGGEGEASSEGSETSEPEPPEEVTPDPEPEPAPEPQPKRSRSKRGGKKGKKR